jgi:hypothetical protein
MVAAYCAFFTIRCEKDTSTASCRLARNTALDALLVHITSDLRSTRSRHFLPDTVELDATGINVRTYKTAIRHRKTNDAWCTAVPSLRRMS